MTTQRKETETVTDHHSSRRAGSSTHAVALVAALVLLAALLAPLGAEAAPPPRGPHTITTTKTHTTKTHTTKTHTTKSTLGHGTKARKRSALAAAPATDISTGLPNVNRSGTTGDFLGRGYAQRAIVESGFLNIYDTPARGGGLLRSTATDLSVPPTVSGDSFYSQHGLTAIYLRWTPTALYMSGSQGSDINFKNVVYRLPPDGSCATRACATWVKDDFDTFKLIGNQFPPELLFPISIMSMAYGTIGTGAAAKGVLAVGLSASGAGDIPSWPSNRTDQQGVWILDAATGMPLSGTNSGYNDYVSRGVDTFLMVPVIDLAWDPRGSGLLSIVSFCCSADAMGNAVRVSAAGTVSGRTLWDFTPTDSTQAILSTAIGYLGDGTTPVVAYGTAYGGVYLWDPATTTTTVLASDTTSSDPVNALSFVDRVVGPAGAQDIVAVSQEHNHARVLRYDTTATLEPQLLAPSSQPHPSVIDLDGIQSWYPGYKAGRLKLTASNPDEDLTVSFAARATEGYGCWYAPAFPDAAAFPNSSSITLPAGGSTTGLFTMGGLTAAATGNCGLGNDPVDQWASYLVVVPASRPAERSTIKLVTARNGEPSVTVVGGSITATATSTRLSDHPGYPLAETTLTLTDPPAAKPAKPLKPTAVQIDNTDPAHPVYRIDVPTSTWTLPPSSPPRISAELKPLEVYGSTSARGQQTLLGYLAPQGVPARAATSGTITLSPVSFYWQNQPAPAAQITHLTITSPDDVAPVSASVDLTQTGPPAGNGATVTNLYICPARGSTACDGTATPYANGLDQAAIRITVVGTSGTLPVSDPAYGRIFYKDADNDLITGLIPTDGSAWIRVSPYRGAYPNDGSNQPPSPPGRVGGQFGYVSTTETDPQQITGWLGNYTTGSTNNGGNIAVDAVPPLSLSTVGTSVSQGFKLNTCTGDFSDNRTCAIAQPRTTSTGLVPAMYYTTDPNSGALRIGLQFQNLAQTSLSSLPLQQIAGQSEHTVADASLASSGGEVTFANADTAFQPADDVDLWLVVHGQQIQVPPINVGQAN